MRMMTEILNNAFGPEDEEEVNNDHALVPSMKSNYEEDVDPQSKSSTTDDDTIEPELEIVREAR